MINYVSPNPSTERLSEDYLAINSCGIEQLYEIDRGSMRKNGRVDYHILYVEQGVCYLESDSEIRAIPKGNVLLFRPGEPQQYHFRADNRSISHYIHFTGVGCEELLKKLGIFDISVFYMGTSATYEEISAKMVREYNLKSPHWETFAIGCLYELLSLIARKHFLRNDNISHKSELCISKACRRIYDNLANPPSVSELAREAHLSVGRFSHLFSEAVGKSPKEFILSLRIDRSRELLENSETTIKELAEIMGFENQNYFSRVFKKRIGCSPTEYRNQLKY